jgi:signal transduction histidine kinase
MLVLAPGATRTKALMLGAFGVIAVLLGCLQTIEYFEERETQAAIELIRKNVVVSVRLVTRIAIDVARERVIVSHHIFERDPQKMAELETKLSVVRDDYASAAREYSPLTILRGEAMVWHQLQSDISAVQAQDDAALVLSKENRNADASDAMTATKGLFERIERRTSMLIELNEHAVDRAARHAVRRHGIEEVVQLGIVIGILVAVLLGGYVVTRAVVRVQHQLERVNTELEKRNRELDAFAGRIAHDLRNPLNTISLAAEMLGAKLPDAVAMTAPIGRGVSRIARLIDDLLVLSRIGSMSRAATRVEAIAPSLQEDLGKIVDDVRGVLRLELEPADVVCSEGLLRQVLWNLGENAIKYRREGVVPELEIAGRIEGSRYAIRVIDNGIGMTGDDARHVFEPFYRSERTSSVPGTGLGLAIVRRIIEASGGCVSLSSEPERGTTFVISLALARTASET